MSRMNPRWLVPIAAIVWSLAIVGGFGALMSYENTPGASKVSSNDWPTDGGIYRDVGRANLIMLAHPLCPCTRASVGELAEIMAQSQGLVKTHVVFYEPSAGFEDWERATLCRDAAAIPGVTVVFDPGGREARRFGAETSGHVVLFNADGKRIFSGGITRSRGVAGVSVGRSAVLDLILRGTASENSAPVFGCSLVGDSENEETAACPKSQSLSRR